MDEHDSADEFQTTRRYQTAAGRLNSIIREARRTVSSTQESSFMSELGSRFPFASPNQTSSIGARRGMSKRRKVNPWKVIPCCLASPSCNRVPTRGPLSLLCKKGLGTLWFCNEDRLEVPTYYTAEEVHYVLVTLFPLLRDFPYEFCKATGPGNNVLVPLSRPNSSELEAATSVLTHTPVFAADQLKGQIGRKGRLYIRPRQDIDCALVPINSNRT